MHQSRKEQGYERVSRRLLHADRREALIFSEMEADIEASAEFGGSRGRIPLNPVK
ncbi:hypothetical protein A8990_11515 [Paenibacillus taihuensis]|uniref:Uncharacterized protein n=1 Tax=Paenibacillus taihuensis TaxID=1156355 RepID=A0A3D9RWI0_9BACL|nr:hypothetical protein [Paenibacillus taihuensis]REE84340.1 hypothetical protein A8990_11515 [Paenibacillus taihuensis]